MQTQVHFPPASERWLALVILTKCLSQVSGNAWNADGMYKSIPYYLEDDFSAWESKITIQTLNTLRNGLP